MVRIFLVFDKWYQAFCYDIFLITLDVNLRAKVSQIVIAKNFPQKERLGVKVPVKLLLIVNGELEEGVTYIRTERGSCFDSSSFVFAGISFQVNIT